MIELDLLYGLSCSGFRLAESAGAGFVAGPALTALVFHCAHDRVGPVLRTRARVAASISLGSETETIISSRGRVQKSARDVHRSKKKDDIDIQDCVQQARNACGVGEPWRLPANWGVTT